MKKLEVYLMTEDKTCPSCGYTGTKRSRNEKRDLACPECTITLVLLDNAWITKDAVPPTKELYEHLVSEMRLYLNTSFYTYEVEEPTIPKKRLKDTWAEHYRKIRESYPAVERQDVIDAFKVASETIISKLVGENNLNMSLVVYSLGKPGWAGSISSRLEAVQKNRQELAEVDDSWLE